MKLTSRVDYALSCALVLAERFDRGAPVPVSEISFRENIDTDYAEQILISMKRAGIVRSVRGKGGGYLLALSPKKITAKEVVQSIEKEILELVCARPKGRRGSCTHIDDCHVKAFWRELGRCMEDFLEGYTLDRLLGLRRNEKGYRYRTDKTG